MKIRHPVANPNSKAQKRKQEFLKAHPEEYVRCTECGGRGTYYKVGDRYICGDCYKANLKKGKEDA